MSSYKCLNSLATSWLITIVALVNLLNELTSSDGWSVAARVCLILQITRLKTVFIYCKTVLLIGYFSAVARAFQLLLLATNQQMICQFFSQKKIIYSPDSEALQSAFYNCNFLFDDRPIFSFNFNRFQVIRNFLDKYCTQLPDKLNIASQVIYSSILTVNKLLANYSNRQLNLH